jgi:RND superfamily putative drug exporter
VFERLADIAQRYPWHIVTAALIFTGAAAWFGLQGAGSLQPAGFDDPATQSIAARERIATATGANVDQSLIALVRAGQSIRAASTRAEVERVARIMARDSAVVRVLTVYQTHDPTMISHDGTSTYMVVEFKNESDGSIERAAARLAAALTSDPRVTVGGAAIANEQINEIVREDLIRAELLAFPLLFVLLFLVFRGLVATLLPPIVGGIAIMGTFFALRLLNAAIPVSVFSLDLVSGLGLGLAIDYSLLILSRYREEVVYADSEQDALRRTLATAGRTVFFSSLTVAAALASLLVFPQRFLYSMGLGGALVTLVDVTAALLVLPAILAILGPRVNALAPRRWQRAPAAADRAGGWYRLSQYVMRHAVPIAVLAGVLLLALGAPFLHVKLTFIDASVLPPHASARQVNDTLQAEFPPGSITHLYVAAREPATASGKRDVQAFVRRIRELPAVQRVIPAVLGRDTWKIDVVSAASDFSSHSQTLVTSIRSLHAPFSFEVGGDTAQFLDYKSSVARHLPLVLVIIGLVLFVVLFLVTGSVILPVKAFLMNLLTLAATFGILVLVFQDGRFERLIGYTSQGALEASQPVLLFVVAFALSTDYGVFLLARIKEAHDVGADNETAVATGIERTGRIVTAAALLLAVAIGAFVTSQIVFIKELGVGTALSVLLDAMIVRALLVPSLMKLLGGWNWWAPAPLRRLQERIKIEEVEPPAARGPALVFEVAGMEGDRLPARAPGSSADPLADQTLVMQRTSMPTGTLRVVAGPAAGRRFKVVDGLSIGRSPESDVVLADPLISGSHARIQQEGPSMVFCDLSSRNGTFIQGEPIQRHVLRDGDVIGLGKTVLRYTER